MNLKQILMELGNRLVSEHGFEPATGLWPKSDNTVAIKDFTDWLNNTPQAQQVLAEMGHEWPVVNKAEGKKKKP